MPQILLIDDDQPFRAMLHLTLSHCGHTVIEARNGREGLKLFESARPDLVITDIVMPESEGIEVLMELRKKHPPVKVIAMSGGSRHSAAKDCLRTAAFMGAAKVLEKPFSNERLMTAVDAVLMGGETPVEPSVAK